MRKRPHQDLVVWKEADKLCLQAYELLPHFPTEERFALCSQIRRAATSIPTNIVEGNYRRSNKERLRFFEIAEGSLEELSYQLSLSMRLGYITNEQFELLDNQIGKVGYLLTKLRKVLSNK
ncbi:MAG: four helix bundle protein [Candidatus Peribacteraceae bacterium]|jgi:four helix bundle protein|nr:four helix bundle protein [Candidatus Peribacteraceae bacterium]HCI03927.1 four helix bundle protein [Candidatus Peribacteria bacterium]|tara:strand:+ start:311 stop:673 length:363 start_codon:yes stop_codon:yes gene_type:complete